MRKKQFLDKSITFQDIGFLTKHYEQVVFLNSNTKGNTSYLALGKEAVFNPTKNHVFDDLKGFVDEHKDWVFGYLGYDLKNEIEPSLSSLNIDQLNFPSTHFFVPKLVVEISAKNCVLHFNKEEEKELFLSFLSKKDKKSFEKEEKIEFSQRISKSEYLEKFAQIKHHIQHGDIYEMNFCHEFYAENVDITPFETYLKLNRLTNTPFSSFYKTNSQFILSGSPERYLKKVGNKITSQPIKGTAKRGQTTEEDKSIKKELSQNQKERSENIMIVDLVRNDLSKTATKASVIVEELCKVYTFDTVHQMISTITSQIGETTHPVEVLKTTFPMGSMTGAPKIEAMKIIEQLETTKRGVYSGAIGYFKPNQDFDFNVVIRTLLYNQKNQYLSFMVGGAITSKSDPEQEYNETLLKAEAMINSFK